MTTKTKLGLFMLFDAAAVVAFAMYEIMSFAGCEEAAVAEVVCQEPGGATVGLLVGGIVAAVVIGIATGAPLFITPFLFLGIGVGSILGGLTDEAAGGRVFPLVFGGGFALLTLGMLAIPVWASRKARAAQRLMATGRKGIGTVQSVADTGVTVNNSPRVRVTYSIALLDGTPPYEAEKSSMFSRLSPPRVGDRYPVWVDTSDPQVFAVGVPETEEAREMVKDQFGFDPRGADAPAAPEPEPAQAAPQPDGATGAVIELQKLNELRRDGAISDAEFETLKAKVIEDAITPD